VRTSGRSRRHLRDCDGCRAYRKGLRGVDEGLAALMPGGAGPLATVAKLLGLGGASSGAAAGAGAGAGGTAAVAGGATAATATATKVVAIVCCAAVVGGGAAEVREQVSPVAPATHAARHVRTTASHLAAVAVAPVKAPVARAMDPVRDAELAAPAHQAPRHRAVTTAPAVATTEPGTGSVAAPAPPPLVTAAPEEAQTGGAMAPDEDSMPDSSGTGAVGAPTPADPGAPPGPTAAPQATPATGSSASAGPVDSGAPVAGATPAG
jgi:hypothetical protein